MEDVPVYRLCRAILTPVIKLLFLPKITGTENIPKGGAILLVGNHSSWFDALLLGASTKRTVHFLAKDSLHRGIKKYLFKAGGTIPVNRDVHDTDAFKSAKEVLLNNRVIGIFPEAHRSRDGNLLPFKTGAVRMARETDTYLVPFVITGKYRLFRKGLKIEFYKKMKIKSDDIKLENEKLMNFFRKKIKENSNEKK